MSFYHFLGTSCLAETWFLRGQKIQLYHESASSGTCRSVISTLREYQNAVNIE